MLSPDGQRYFAMGSGVPQAIPYHYRWLLPRALGTKVRRWEINYWVSLYAVAVFTTFLCFQAGLGSMSYFAPWFLVGLAIVPWWNSTPVLTDVPSMAWALLAAVLPEPWGVIPALIGGCIRETTPIYAALYAWNPYLLLGLAAPAIRHFLFPVGVEQNERMRGILEKPFSTAFRANRAHFLSAPAMLLPWGGLMAAFFLPTWQLIVTVVICYAQIFRSMDMLRLYSMAAPVLILAVLSLPINLVLPLLLVHWFAPWQKWIDPR